MSLFGDSLTLLNDLKSLGLASPAVYYAKGSETAVNCVAAIEIQGVEHAEELPGEVQRTIASITVAASQVPLPDYGGRIVVSSGMWAGEYYIYGKTNDDDSWVLDCRTDVGVSARSAGVRRLGGQ